MAYDELKMIVVRLKMAYDKSKMAFVSGKITNDDLKMTYVGSKMIYDKSKMTYAEKCLTMTTLLFHQTNKVVCKIDSKAEEKI